MGPDRGDDARGQCPVRWGEVEARDSEIAGEKGALCRVGTWYDMASGRGLGAGRFEAGRYRVTRGSEEDEGRASTGGGSWMCCDGRQ